MNEIKTKLSWKGIGIIFLQALIIPYGLILNYLLYKISKSGSEFILHCLIFGSFVTLFSFFFLYVAFRKLSKNATYATISKNGIHIKRPVGFSIHYFDWSEIKGYSKTDYTYCGGTLPLISKAIIIYTKNKMTFEIIEVYNSNYLNFQKYLKKFHVVYLGTEKYERGRFGNRKTYKYLDL